MEKIVIGKVDKQQKEMRGWLVGQFMSEGSFKDESLEIYYKTFQVGNPGDKLHVHPQGKEYLVILDGRARMRLGEEVVEIKKGDYLAIPGGIPDQIAEVLEELTVIGVRYPSIPNNKVFLE